MTTTQYTCDVCGRVSTDGEQWYKATTTGSDTRIYLIRNPGAAEDDYPVDLCGPECASKWVASIMHRWSQPDDE